MPRPHVLYVTPICGYPPRGGPRLRTYATLRALSRWADVSLHLTQPLDAADPEAARQHFLTFCRGVSWPAAAGRPAGALRRALPRPLRPLARAALHLVRPRPTAGAERQDPALAALEPLAAWVPANAVDLVWLGFGGISYPLVRLKERTGRPVVVETESVWSRFLLRELPFEPDPRRRERIARAGRAKEAEERWGTALADVTTAASEVDAAYFRQLTPHPERVMLLSNVIDVEAYAREDVARPPLAPNAVCLPGTLSEGTANVDAAAWLLDEVMPRVWSRRPDVSVYLVGRDPAPRLRARQGRRVHVTGAVDSIVPYLRQCAAAVVPLRWESGTRFKILEAFACRAPVVSTTLGAEGLAVEAGRHLLIADAPEEFARAILALVERPGLAASLVGPASELVQREYGLPVAERQVAAVLERLGLPARAAARR